MLKDNFPRYSICIPAYKSRFLRECIQSILAQRYTDFELIILNDCSPEPVKRIASNFKDGRIRYEENDKNVGAVRLVDNWNKCLQMAKGEFIMIMGDDDMLASDYLDEFEKLIQSYPALDVYHCRSTIINSKGEPVMLTPALPSYEQVYDSIWHRLHQLRSNYISDYVYRTDTLRQRGGFYDLPLAWGTDDITAFIASKDKGIAHTNKPVFHYRSNELSITSTGNDLKKMEAQMGYAAWLGTYLTQMPSDEADRVVYRHLVDRQSFYMQQRRIYTMTVSMQKQPWKKTLFWLKHGKQFGISAKEVLTALFTAIKRNQ
ncbi:glycosyltransferase [Olivibacter sitiensis]|uniref:glycosyltransferase n=1 Tax=Olivibacter sitiensis TaxID=376470 RepID=UPI00048467A6|nr:glycosyltransferase [Olivibacter sitiensis]